VTRIVFFDGYPHMYAGAQRATLISAVALRARGWDVEVILPGEGAFSDQLRAEGVPVRIVPTPVALGRFGHHERRALTWRTATAVPSLIRYWWSLRGALRGSELAHINDHRGLVLAGPAARMAGVPFVWHTHGVLPPHTLNRVGHLLARRTIVLTTADAGLLPGNRIRPTPEVVPNAPDPRLFSVTRRTSMPPMIVTMARLNEIKGLDVLLEAMGIVRRRRPDVTATVLGGPQLGYAHHADELERLRAKLHLDGIVTFAGHVEQPHEVLATAAVYVQPSRWEGVPIAVLEAMALGLPVVATRVGGLAEVVDHNVTGLLVPPSDADALAAAILQLLDDPALADRLGHAGQARARTHHSVDASVTRLVEVYRAALCR
jgi:glycosyltransferase involved in cell wall biosynthesis